jgi:hypothetical protein
MCASVSGMYPIRERISCGASATSRPSTRISPWFGFTNPRSDFSKVLLPAPLGPSRPTAPLANDVLTSRSAWFFP